VCERMCVSVCKCVLTEWHALVSKSTWGGASRRGSER